MCVRIEARERERERERCISKQFSALLSCVRSTLAGAKLINLVAWSGLSYQSSLSLSFFLFLRLYFCFWPFLPSHCLSYQRNVATNTRKKQPHRKENRKNKGSRTRRQRESSYPKSASGSAKEKSKKERERGGSRHSNSVDQLSHRVESHWETGKLLLQLRKKGPFVSRPSLWAN